MKFKTLTRSEKAAARTQWRKKFVIFPREVADGEYVWLGVVEFREKKIHCTSPGLRPYFFRDQYRAVGSESDGHPVMPDRTPPPMPKVLNPAVTKRLVIPQPRCIGCTGPYNPNACDWCEPYPRSEA
jgi:hypothetical protein